MDDAQRLRGPSVSDEEVEESALDNSALPTELDMRESKDVDGALVVAAERGFTLGKLGIIPGG